MTGTGRAKWSTKPHYFPECLDCGWTIPDSKAALGTAARHHDATGHKVRVGVESAIYYGEDRPGARRWWKAPK